MMINNKTTEKQVCCIVLNYDSELKQDAELVPHTNKNKKANLEKLKKINSKFLNETSSRCPSGFKINLDQIAPENIYNFKAKICESIPSLLEPNSISFIDDPNVCRLLPLYIDVLTDLNVNTCFVLPFSEKSAENNGLSWLRFYLEAEIHTRNFTRFFIDNDNFETSSEVMNQLLSNEGIQNRIPLNQKFITSTPELENSPTRLQNHCNELLIQMKAQHSNQLELGKSLTPIWVDLNISDDMYHTEVQKINLKLHSEIDTLSENIRSQAEALKNDLLQKEPLTATIDELRKQLQAKTRYLKDIEHLYRKATADVNEANSRVLLIQHSTSWKLTRPVRGAKRFLQNQFNFKKALKEMKIKSVISKSELFDGNWYQDTYQDIAMVKTNALTHFVRHGASEFRNPSPLFNTQKYCLENPDVDPQNVNPLYHYLAFGKAEGRSPL